MKFSIIIPVYNVEKYIGKCLESICNQTYEDYEVIIVNDGTLDNSQIIIDEYTSKDCRFVCYVKENGGLSDARNYGVEYATGEYILFLDSDDYIEKDLLANLSKCSLGHDVIKYKLNLVDEDGNLIRKENGFNESCIVDFKRLISLEFFEPAWSYAYNLEFWKKYSFHYEVGKIHEDFGLTPLCIILANSIYYLNYYGYNYVQRVGSIMNGASKNKKRANDMLYHFDNLNKTIENYKVNEDEKKLFKSFIANGIISTAKLLEGNEFEEYLQELKNREVYDYLLSNTFKRKLKKQLIKFNIKFYINKFVK